MSQIDRRSFLGASGALVGSGLITAQPDLGQNHDKESAGGVGHQGHALSLMTDTAHQFLAALSPERVPRPLSPLPTMSAWIGTTFRKNARD
jgi:hypothetical protein